MMMKNKHTPAPWEIRFFGGKDDGENQFFIEAKNNNKPELGYGIEIMMDDFGDHNGYPREQRLADASLIAAAPELLECLSNAPFVSKYNNAEDFISAYEKWRDTEKIPLINKLLYT